MWCELLFFRSTLSRIHSSWVLDAPGGEISVGSLSDKRIHSYTGHARHSARLCYWEYFLPAHTFMPSLAPLRLLNDGHSIPTMGLGVYRVPPGNATYSAVRMAIKNGYRLIDTAQAYFNERAVGNAVRDSNVAREELFITTKLSSVWMSHLITYNRTLALLHSSLRKLGMTYVDLYLIHSPRDASHRLEQWRALTHAKDTGLVRSIGVSDYEVAQLRELAAERVPPAILQIELSPWLANVREAELRYCREHDIVVQAWGVMATGSQFDDPALQRIARRHGESAANVLLGWSASKGAIRVITSQNQQHQVANLAFAASRRLNFTDADTPDLRSLAARPFYSDGEEDSGVAFSAVWLVISGLHDTAVLLSDRLHGLDASDLVGMLTVGLLVWLVLLVAVCVAGLRCSGCTCNNLGAKTYSSTYNPPARRAGRKFEFGNMELH